ncbi:MAG: hypothetical protein H7Y30_05470 [Pyrinomonadaceae bacterium]|nr:hypothetical protein [Pyrinomonadaceae bacterium]
MSISRTKLPVIQTTALPPLYAAWIDELLAGPIPRETDATCDDCAMLSDAGTEAESGETFFNPETKCCAYVPELPNYLVGRMLADRDAAFAKGRATVVERLQAGVGVTPLGMEPPPIFSVLYGRSSATLFGQSRSLRCPHYLADEGGRCGVWKHRASVCATWHCKYVRGATGMTFWQTLHKLLSTIEQSLARWCVHELDPGGDALKLLFPLGEESARTHVDPHALDGAPEPKKQRALWGNWAGREAEFYQECARLVELLKWPDVLALSDPAARIYARMTGAAYGQLMSAELPKALKVGSFRCDRLKGDTQVINSMELPHALLEALPYFDGRPTQHALAAIRAERGIILHRALVRKLVDFQILVSCEQPSGAS